MGSKFAVACQTLMLCFVMVRLSSAAVVDRELSSLEEIGGSLMR